MKRISGIKLGKWIAAKDTNATKLADIADVNRDTVYKVLNSGSSGSRVQERTAHRLAEAVGASIADLEVDGPTQNKMTPTVANGLRNGATGGAPTSQWLYATDFSPLLAELQLDFVGREWLFASVNQWMDCGTERLLIVSGEAQCGKSAFAAELIARNRKRVIAYHICYEDAPQSAMPGPFVRNMAAMIAQRLPTYREKIQEPRFHCLFTHKGFMRDARQAFEDAVLGPLFSLPEPEQAYFMVLDGIDWCAHEPTPDCGIFALVFRRIDRFPPWLKVIMTDATPKKGPHAILELDRKCDGNRNDIEMYVKMRCERAPLKDAALRIPLNEIVGAVWSKSGGQFGYVKYILDRVANGEFRFGRHRDWPTGKYADEA